MLLNARAIRARACCSLYISQQQEQPQAIMGCTSSSIPVEYDESSYFENQGDRLKAYSTRHFIKHVIINAFQQ
jgi:hypothetical protein